MTQSVMCIDKFKNAMEAESPVGIICSHPGEGWWRFNLGGGIGDKGRRQMNFLSSIDSPWLKIGCGSKVEKREENYGSQLSFLGK